MSPPLRVGGTAAKCAEAGAGSYSSPLALPLR
jgi:hypothetical protein